MNARLLLIASLLPTLLGCASRYESARAAERAPDPRMAAAVLSGDWENVARGERIRFDSDGSYSAQVTVGQSTARADGTWELQRYRRIVRIGAAVVTGGGPEERQAARYALEDLCRQPGWIVLYHRNVFGLVDSKRRIVVFERM
ncbi:MAG TPA: hypothetical protein VM328_11145 [Fimbriimonadaceae bacterium]|nr:hypothetical protein [Fimbriimonadaceae bacterium]